MSTVRLFDLPFDNFDYDDLMAYIDRAVASRNPEYLVTCNVDHLVKLRQDEQFRRVYGDAGSIVADGMPLVWSSKLLGKPLKTRVAGSDMLLRLGGELERRKYRMFFLGAAEGVAEQAKRELLKRFPAMEIVGCYSPSYGFENDDGENGRIVAMIREAKPDIVWVGVGAPKQEKWIHRFRHAYGAPLSIGIGATFDFLSGNVKRAPKWVQAVGMEWFWRMCSEPRRLWRRYLIEDMRFMGLLVREIKNERRRRNDEYETIGQQKSERGHSGL